MPQTPPGPPVPPSADAYDPAAATQPIRIETAGPDAAVPPAGGEVAQAVQSALAPSLTVLATGLGALQDRLGGQDPELERMASGMAHAQRVLRKLEQFTRLASPNLRRAPERLHLDVLLAEQLRQWEPGLQARGIQLRHHARPVQAVLDRPLLLVLLDAAIRWAAQMGNELQVRLDVKIWPQHAQLSLRAGREGGYTPRAQDVDGLDWQLLVQAAAATQVALDRSLGAQAAVLAIQFPSTVARHEDLGITPLDVEQRGGSSPRTGSHLHGRKVLLVTGDARLRLAVVERCKGMGLEVAFAHNSEEAGEALREHGAPGLLIVDENQHDGAFEAMRRHLLAADPELPTIEITNVDHGFHLAGWDSGSISRLARDAVPRHLGVALENAGAQGR